VLLVIMTLVNALQRIALHYSEASEH